MSECEGRYIQGEGVDVVCSTFDTLKKITTFLLGRGKGGAMSKGAGVTMTILTTPDITKDEHRRSV